MANFDLVCYLYDSSDANSFGYIAHMREKYKTLQSLPCVIVASKSDLDRVPQRCELQPDQYCRQFSLPTPICLSAKDGLFADLFQTIINVAINPATAIPAPFTERYRKPIITGAVVTGVSAAILALSFIVYRYTRDSK